MNARGEIYEVPPGTEVPAEDRARLEGYLLALDDARQLEAQSYPDSTREKRLLQAEERLRMADEDRRRYQRRHL